MIDIFKLVKIGNHVLNANNLGWICTYCNKVSNGESLPVSFMFFESENCLTDEEKLIKDIIE
jgi:hypothetical protein